MKKNNARRRVAGLLVWFAILIFGGIPQAWSEEGPTVTDVTARQRYPWNGLVDITCKVTGIEGESTGLKFAVAAVDGDSGGVQDVSHMRVVKDGVETDDLTVQANGTYALVWDARADLGEGQWSDMVARVTVAEDDPGPRGRQLWEEGPYWADRNIGAENPWDYGLYFWWGDATGYRPSGTTFSFNFLYDNSAISTWGKDYATLQSEGWITAAGVLTSAHDAAHVHWGGAWRMPTDAEFSALVNKCDWTWTTMNGVNGYAVRGRGAYAVNSIFLPAAGLGYKCWLYDVGSGGAVWSSVPGSGNNSGYSFCLGFNSRDYYTNVGLDYRDFGYSVRPVRRGAN